MQITLMLQGLDGIKFDNEQIVPRADLGGRIESLGCQLQSENAQGFREYSVLLKGY